MSLVVHCEEGSAKQLEAAVDASLAQSWEAIEVIVADDAGGEASSVVVSSRGDRVRRVGPRGERSALEQAIDAAEGHYVAFADLSEPLEPDAVRKAIAFPHATGDRSFWAAPDSDRQWMRRALLANEEIAALVPPGRSYVLVNESLWSPELLPDRPALPLLERGGIDWGRPADDDEAIAALESQRAGGSSFFVLAWPAFWWLDYYGGLARHLESNYRRAIKNARLIAFDLGGA